MLAMITQLIALWYLYKCWFIVVALLDQYKYLHYKNSITEHGAPYRGVLTRYITEAWLLPNLALDMVV